MDIYSSKEMTEPGQKLSQRELQLTTMHIWLPNTIRIEAKHEG